MQWPVMAVTIPTVYIMLLLGIDVGTSSIKVAVVDAASAQCVAQVQYPDTETPITSRQPGWAEQSPQTWWQHVQCAIQKLLQQKTFDATAIGAIGIAYQMHGLVTIDKEGQPLRDAIIWCDSRAVPYGEKAAQAIGAEKCLAHLLNSPGNFTAAKLAWVKEAEPQVYERIHKIMLPGDYIVFRLTQQATTSVSALSEGIFWDFKKDALSPDVMQHFGFEASLIPPVHPVFSEHGRLSKTVAETLGLKEGIPVTYKSGDQPNNALSLNVLQPGEVAATAGTSGVIYGVTDKLKYDPQSRVNTFAHVNYKGDEKRLGVLLCINGTGILNHWVKQNLAPGTTYQQMNDAASQIAIGADGLLVLPFGNGAERMLNNKRVGAHFLNIDFNVHTQAHIFRAVQEGIAFAFRYGLDIMRESGMHPQVIRAGKTNLFLSALFTEAFVNATGVPVELYAADGSVGAAIGAGIGAGLFNESNAFNNAKPLQVVQPTNKETYDDLYQKWQAALQKHL